ncbi:MAG: radical SAM family heme chaperone HemW [Bacteroidales bacterium]|nr:radical SAM family heme chaperone HemW [Bacteroidales bacterium]
MKLKSCSDKVIYIHIPFCRSFCTYCDFYSEIAARCRKADGPSLFTEYGRAVALEALARREEITDEVNTLYIGGGTPSVLPLSVFSTIMEALAETGHGGPYDEFTVEVNPDDIIERGHSYVEGLLELGVTRISMGVQSFDDGILRWMNRRHDSPAARMAYAILEEAGADNISIDLIFGLPQLSETRWRDTLSAALDISPNGLIPKHISAYQLSVEPGSALAGLVEKGKWSEASEELCAAQYEIMCGTLAAAGYNHYEISNFALPGHEALHNSAYWRHIPYVGLGPAAHSFMGNVRQWNSPDLHSYLEAARAGNFEQIRDGETLTGEQIALEHIMLALRTSEGIPYDYLKSCSDPAVLSGLIEGGHLVTLGTGKVRIPENRFFISDSIISELV